MPAATRSSTRSLASSAPIEIVQMATKRKAPTSTKAKAKKPKAAQDAVQQQIPPSVSLPCGAAPALIPAQLSFSFDDAKQHLIRADPRFEDIFGKLRCTPFEVLEQVHPFRSLATSIIAQQISWKAARSINHKFKRIYDPSLPENVTDYTDNSATSFFPSPEQVVATDPSILRSAGLSERKGEYVQDLASRFADGRLSTEKLIKATDEDLSELLIAVKGIGKWTVDMFAIFSLRRPNILPVGDLGIQRGVIRWFLSLHSPTYNYAISEDKKGGGTSSKSPKKKKSVSEEEENDNINSVADIERPLTPDLSSAPPRGLPSTPLTQTDTGAPDLPPAFTPSINKTLHKVQDISFVPEPLPEGLSVAALKARLEGKRKIKGALLTPAEMESLTISWKPYRSLAVYYMWALADGDES
ncbi:DNA glycosylase [Guyanagaster necrorhizus]|uniref:DNA glycosylase n=1 Tax=Guyanagaster necrorhizus TaxID=856835 RepID=A0A9P8AVW9_9AGAR|nr:DNA glycosylase [Guyanagaster necrorhizus MCA 3950]KAG7449541.1 DNA glycosylase [Guyanagaster necrorhizus MCA 3950]